MLLELTICVRKLQPQDIIPIKSVPLESVDNNSCLKRVLKVSKAEKDLFPIRFFSRNESQLLVARKWPEKI